MAKIEFKFSDTDTKAERVSKLIDAPADDAWCLKAKEAAREMLKGRESFAKLDLVGARMDGMDLSGCDFTGANCFGTNFSGSNLAGADFSGADLLNANFTGATLTGANFDGSDTRFATVTDAVGVDAIEKARLK